jgi:hypothetical protein
MNKGKWEESEDFRAQLKDESEVQALEQQAKAVTGLKRPRRTHQAGLSKSRTGTRKPQ